MSLDEFLILMVGIEKPPAFGTVPTGERDSRCFKTRSLKPCQFLPGLAASFTGVGFSFPTPEIHRAMMAAKCVFDLATTQIGTATTLCVDKPDSAFFTFQVIDLVLPTAFRAIEYRWPQPVFHGQ
jgi:hypothetical protein